MITLIKHLFSTAITHEGFRRYFANTSWMFGEQVLRIIAGLFVGIWVARYLGPKQFGMFSYVTAFVAIFSTIAKLGLDGIVVRDLVNDPLKSNAYLGTAFWLKLFGGLIALVVIVFATLLISNDHTTNLYIFIIASGIIFQSFEVVDFYFQSRVLSKFVSLCKMTQLLLSSLLKIYFVLTGADLFWFVVVSFIDQLSLAVTFYIAYKYQKNDNFYHHFDLGIAKNFLKFSWPMIFSGLVVMVYMRIDQIMIKEMLGDKELGVYSSAVRLSEAWYFIPMVITSSLFPAIVSAKKISKELYYSRLQNLYTFMVWMSIAIAIPMTFLSDWLVMLLYGEAYIGAGKILMIQTWAGVFVFLGVASSSWLTSENLQIIAFYRTLGGAIINIVLNLLLIPVYGITGAAIATLVSYMFAGFLFDMLNRNTKKMFLMKISAFGLKGIKEK